MSEAFEVVVESNDEAVNARVIVRADTTQQLHDRLTAIVDAASFTLIGAATAAMRDEVNAHRVLGATLDARPDNPPVNTPAKVEESGSPAGSNELPPPPAPPASNPWKDPADEGTDGPKLPTPSAPVAPPAGGLPPMPKWAQ